MFMVQAQPEPNKYYDIEWIPKLSEYMHTLQKDIKVSMHACMCLSQYILKTNSSLRLD